MKLGIITAIILCLFVCVLSANEHEHKHAKHNKKDSRHVRKYKHNHDSKHLHKSRFLGLHSIHTRRPDKKKDGELIHNGDLGIVGLANLTEKVSAFLDLKAKIIAVINHKGEAVLYDSVQKEVTVATDPNHDPNKTFQEYFDTIKSLSDLKKNGTSCSVSEAANNTKVLQIANQVNGYLGYKVRENSSDGFDYLQKNVQRILDSLEIYKIVFKGKGKIDGITANVDRIVTALLGVKILFESSDLQKLNDKINISAIVNTKNGPEAFLTILEAVQNDVDLSKLSTLKDPEKLLQVLVLLGTKSPGGIDGYFSVLYNIVSLISGHGDLNTLIKSIIDYFSDGSADYSPQELTDFISKVLDVLTKQDGVFHNSEALSTFKHFLEGLRDGHFSINQVNLSDIISLLSDGKPQDALQRVVKIVIDLGQFVGPEQGIQKLFISLVTSLNTTEGLGNIKQLFPNINVTALLNSGNPLKVILNGSNITGILNSNGTLPSIESIPVIGDIYTSLSKQFHNLSNGSINFSDIFNPSKIANIFQDIIKEGFSISGTIIGTLQSIPVHIFENVQNGVQEFVHGVENVFGGDKDKDKDKDKDTDKDKDKDKDKDTDKDKGKDGDKDGDKDKETTTEDATTTDNSDDSDNDEEGRHCDQQKKHHASKKIKSKHHHERKNVHQRHHNKRESRKHEHQ